MAVEKVIYNNGCIVRPLSMGDSDSEDYWDDGDSIHFSPPAYLQRYHAVQCVLEGERYYKKLKKLVDFGCAELSFFMYLKSIKMLEEIICVDIDRQLLERRKDKIAPMHADYLHRRSLPLTVYLCEGSITQNDRLLNNTDAVTCIELIEHMETNSVINLQYNIFGYIKPLVAVMTTPNADFNVLFHDFRGQRHFDHRFEWTRQQFQDWAENIVLRYPDYEVTFQGIAEGPDGTEHVGCLSQMAIFHRKREITEIEDFGVEGLFKIVDKCEYPFQRDNRSDEQKILDEAEYYIRHFNNTDNLNGELEFERLLRMLQKFYVSFDTARSILEEGGWQIVDRDTGVFIIVPIPSIFSDFNSDENLDGWFVEPANYVSETPDDHSNPDANWQSQDSYDEFSPEILQHDEIDHDVSFLYNEEYLQQSPENISVNTNALLLSPGFETSRPDIDDSTEKWPYNDSIIIPQSRYVLENNTNLHDVDDINCTSETSQTFHLSEISATERHLMSHLQCHKTEKSELVVDKSISSKDYNIEMDTSSNFLESAMNYSSLEDNIEELNISENKAHSTPKRKSDKIEYNFPIKYTPMKKIAKEKCEPIAENNDSLSELQLIDREKSQISNFSSCSNLWEQQKCDKVLDKEESVKTTYLSNIKISLEDLKGCNSKFGLDGSLSSSTNPSADSKNALSSSYEADSNISAHVAPSLIELKIQNMQLSSESEFSMNFSSNLSEEKLKPVSNEMIQNDACEIQFTSYADNADLVNRDDNPIKTTELIESQQFTENSESSPNSWSPEIVDSGYPNSRSAQDVTPEYDLLSIAQDRISDSGSSSEAIAPRLAEVAELAEVENGDLANNNRDREGNNMVAVEVNDVDNMEPLINILEDDMENENDIYVVQNGFPLWLLGILEHYRDVDEIGAPDHAEGENREHIQIDNDEGFNGSSNSSRNDIIIDDDGHNGDNNDFSENGSSTDRDFSDIASNVDSDDERDAEDT